MCDGQFLFQVQLTDSKLEQSQRRHRRNNESKVHVTAGLWTMSVIYFVCCGLFVVHSVILHLQEGRDLTAAPKCFQTPQERPLLDISAITTSSSQSLMFNLLYLHFPWVCVSLEHISLRKRKRLQEPSFFACDHVHCWRQGGNNNSSDSFIKSL